MIMTKAGNNFIEALFVEQSIPDGPGQLKNIYILILKV